MFTVYIDYENTPVTEIKKVYSEPDLHALTNVLISNVEVFQFKVVK